MLLNKIFFLSKRCNSSNIRSLRKVNYCLPVSLGTVNRMFTHGQAISQNCTLPSLLAQLLAQITGITIVCTPLAIGFYLLNSKNDAFTCPD